MMSLLHLMTLAIVIFETGSILHIEALSTIKSSNKGSRSGGVVSVVTGANGYVGREIVHALLSGEGEGGGDGRIHWKTSGIAGDVLCLVRPGKVSAERDYWTAVMKEREMEAEAATMTTVHVLPYDMLDGGKSLADALERAQSCGNGRGGGSGTVVYHVASVFGPTDDHERTALENVRGTEDVVRTLARHREQNGGGGEGIGVEPRLIVTSSMAAVRGNGQIPKNGKVYTQEDWNDVSVLGANWGQSYQWSKTRSEWRARELSRKLNVPLTTLCPSFVFGPVRTKTRSSSSYSIKLVRDWIAGSSPVQSRLCVDVRDLARAHVAAASSLSAVNGRYIVSSEARLSSSDAADALRRTVLDHQNHRTGLTESFLTLFCPDKIHCDLDFDGGAIKIGDQEVMAAERMKSDLGGLVCRPVEQTLKDMCHSILLSSDATFSSMSGSPS